ncbi:MAG: tetratricopeptide repeat protein [Tannerellaceae bacterium]|jgi:tetratricopeptide (TPR) repeat protein|nr:tetratricopeptide repeat protein [Tannerellaceae bacterium]
MRNKLFLTFLLPLLLFSYGKAQTERWQELVNSKRYASVIAEAKSLTPEDSTDYRKMNLVAQAYEGVLKYRDALGFYRHCFQLDSTNMDNLNALARTATNLGRAAEAESYFRKVLATDSTNFYAQYQLARLYQQTGRYDEAIDTYYTLLEQDPENAFLLRSIGDCHAHWEEWVGATLSYRRAYMSNKENAGLGSALINTMLRVGGEFLPEALEIADTALYYNPGNRLLRQNKGLALYMNRRFAEADTLYTELLAEGDSTYLTLKFCGSARYYAGQHYKSIDPLEYAYAMDPTVVEVCLLLGSALGKTYDRKRAYALFDEAEECMKPDEFLSGQLSMFKAELLQKDNRRDEAALLYYRLWQKNKKLSLLAMISNLYYASNVSQYKSPERRQRAIFSIVLYLNELIAKEDDLTQTRHYRRILNSLQEDLFFRNATEEPMLSPDGKKSSLPLDDLKALITIVNSEQ